jgi:hypothetical protein
MGRSAEASQTGIGNWTEAGATGSDGSVGKLSGGCAQILVGWCDRDLLGDPLTPVPVRLGYRNFGITASTLFAFSEAQGQCPGRPATTVKQTLALENLNKTKVDI